MLVLGQGAIITIVFHHLMVGKKHVVTITDLSTKLLLVVKEYLRLYHQ